MLTVSSDDVSKLQTALDFIVEWAASWQLQLSVSKCCTLSVGRALATTDYSIGDTVLPHGTKCRDLGVMITQDLSPAVHIMKLLPRLIKEQTASYGVLCQKTLTY